MRINRRTEEIKMIMVWLSITSAIVGVALMVAGFALKRASQEAIIADLHLEMSHLRAQLLEVEDLLAKREADSIQLIDSMYRKTGTDALNSLCNTSGH
jgi:hypothetical protein